jgi:hypothetical protein
VVVDAVVAADAAVVVEDGDSSPSTTTIGAATMTRTTRILPVLAIAFLAVAMPGCNNTITKATKPSAEQAKAAPPQRTFASPEDALQALVAAMRAHDTQQLEAIFGPDNDDLVFSGDAIDDQIAQDRFLKAYDEKHQLVADDERNASFTVVVGNDQWPLPIPIVKDESGRAWIFDADIGGDEVITRRIGRNELTVIEVCKAIGDAQREYAQRDPNHDAIPEYARKFFSDPGKTNGLYWPTTEGEKESPLGELVAEAQGEGYPAPPPSTGEPQPYHGYLYRILTAQGKDAPGGARDYVVNGKFIGGFAIVAWPADYGSSGIMTFITNYDGEVYQKDLGEDTAKLASAMIDYNPDPTWKKAESIEDKK